MRADYDRLEADARATGALLPAEMLDAYYELVLHDVEAAANLNRLYRTVAINRLHAAQGRADTNRLADEAERLFAEDKAIARRYEARAAGKWVHMMDQTHISYTSWQQPDVDVMPAVRRIALPADAAMGVAVEGSADAWTPGAPAPAALVLERFGTADRHVEIFDRGTQPFAVTAHSDAQGLHLDRTSATVGIDGIDLTARVDWARAPAGISHGTIRIEGPQTLSIPVTLINHPDPTAHAGFIEADGHVVIEAAHFDRATPVGGVAWQVVPGLGRTRSAVTPFPQTASSQVAGYGPSLDYAVTLHQPGTVALSLIASPSLDTRGGRGLRYAIAIDDAPPQTVDLLAGDSQAAWDKAVIDAARGSVTTHTVASAGRHVVHLWMIDPGLVVQRLVLGRDAVSADRLGPVESTRIQ